jgi:hypothetical protein
MNSRRFTRNPSFVLQHSFNHVIGLDDQRLWDRDAERLRSLEVDHALEFGHLHDWQVGGLGAPERITA